MTSKLEHIKCFLLDMDGTINLGERPIEGAEQFFDVLARQGKEFIFLTNNSSKSRNYYVRRLNRMGIPATLDRVVTSTDALVRYLRNCGSAGATLYPIGTPYFEQDLTRAGFNLVFDRSADIDYVVLGFDTSLHYEKLSLGCRLIQSGVPYIATNPDLRCPIESEEYIPDCGALIRAIEACTGISPLQCVGKPKPFLVDVILERGYRPEQLAVVGDRLYTDIALGRNSNITSVLVLTGESTLDDVENSDVRPDYILPSIKVLGEILDPEQVCSQDNHRE